MCLISYIYLRNRIAGLAPSRHLRNRLHTFGTSTA